MHALELFECFKKVGPSLVGDSEMRSQPPTLEYKTLTDNITKDRSMTAFPIDLGAYKSISLD
ncbi:MAG: hypothetical protein AAF974_04770, partial [Cyanobacteria bacterium P01_E01_bin.34]